MEKTEIPAQVLVRTVNKKPGLRDGNFQVLKAKFDVVKSLAENAKFTRYVQCVIYCISFLQSFIYILQNNSTVLLARCGRQTWGS